MEEIINAFIKEFRIGRHPDRAYWCVLLDFDLDGNGMFMYYTLDKLPKILDIVFGNKCPKLQFNAGGQMISITKNPYPCRIKEKDQCYEDLGNFQEEKWLNGVM